MLDLTKARGGLLPLFAAGGAAAVLNPEEAEAAVRPDIGNIIQRAIAGEKFTGGFAGTLESPVAAAALKDSTKYKGNTGYFTEHGLTQRNMKDGWTYEQIAEGYRGIYDSPDTVVIPNVLGVNPTAKEALWNPAAKWTPRRCQYFHTKKASRQARCTPLKPLRLNGY